MTGKCLRWLMIVCLFVCLLLAGSAFAAGNDPVTIGMSFSNYTFTGPDTITVEITLTNSGDAPLPGEMTLYYPSGKQIEEFGTPVLAAGEVKTWTGTWSVTQTELEAGAVTFKVKYSIYNEEGATVKKTKNFSKRITYTQGEPALSVKRTITPTRAGKGQEVSVTYEVENTGGVDLTNVTIKENSAVSSKSGVIKTLAVGEKNSYTFTLTMGTKDLTSAATVTYKAGAKTYSQKVESAVIYYGEVSLTASLSADKKGGAPGDTVKLSLKLKNSGKKDLTSVSATDPVLGTVFSGETVPAGKTVTLEKEITITESQTLQFTVTAEDGTGEPVETATGRLSLIATDESQAVKLSVEAQADRESVYSIPGTVRFTITVRNEGATDVSNVTVKAVDQTIKTYETISAGQSKTFVRDMDVSMVGTYAFTASCKDVLDQTQSFMSNGIYISYAMVTAAPTEVPIPTPVAPVYENIPTTVTTPDWMKSVLQIADQAKWILSGVVGVLVLLLLVGAVRRIAHHVHSSKAMGSLKESYYRDYTTEVKDKHRSLVVDHEQPEENEQEDTAQDSELMAETLKRLYEEKSTEAGPEVLDSETQTETEAANEAAPAAETAAPAEDEAKAEAVPEQEERPVVVRSAAEASRLRRGQRN